MQRISHRVPFHFVSMRIWVMRFVTEKVYTKMCARSVNLMFTSVLLISVIDMYVESVMRRLFIYFSQFVRLFVPVCVCVCVYIYLFMRLMLISIVSCAMLFRSLLLLKIIFNTFSWSAHNWLKCTPIGSDNRYLGGACVSCGGFMNIFFCMIRIFFFFLFAFRSGLHCERKRKQIFRHDMLQTEHCNGQNDLLPFRIKSVEDY